MVIHITTYWDLQAYTSENGIFSNFLSVVVLYGAYHMSHIICKNRYLIKQQVHFIFMVFTKSEGPFEIQKLKK